MYFCNIKSMQYVLLILLIIKNKKKINYDFTGVCYGLNSKFEVAQSYQ